MLAELLSAHGPVARPALGGMWEVSVPIRAQAGTTLSVALAATSQWLDLCGLPSATVTLNGHEHVLRGSSSIVMH